MFLWLFFVSMILFEKLFEFFGFFGVVECFVVVLGLFVFGYVIVMIGLSCYVVVLVVIFFFVGGVLLFKVDVEEGVCVVWL